LNRILPFLFALLGGTLLSVAWPPLPYTPLLFIAWIPLLWVERTVRSNGLFFSLLLLHMLVWNGLTTWWIWYASVPGAVSAIVANSLLMCLPWLGYRFIKKKKGLGIGSLALVTGWMAFEYIHLQDWGLSWPWLTLGNGLASQTGWIQWYEYTGTSGGTLWILAVNILLFLQWHQYKNPETQKIFPYRWIALAVLAIPIGISQWIGNNLPDQSDTELEVAVLQPNIDPYEKVSSYTSFDIQLQNLIRQSEENITENTSLLIWPETALYRSGGIGEKDLTERGQLYDSLWTFLRRYPKLTLFTGVESYGITSEKSPNSIPAPDWLQKPGEVKPLFVESYNGAAVLDSNGAGAFYHKSKLVPGVEALPGFLQFLSAWFEEFGGTAGGYTPQSERTVLSATNGFRLAPAICYESIYGEHLSRYFKEGANLLTIVTNDGWWQNTPGHKQHALYAALRAIENRRWVARSANTGISGFISPQGKWIDPQPYNTAACIRRSIPVQTTDYTFYARFGDILSKLALAFYVGLWAWSLVSRGRNQNA
jgi:apolipoprotein N-acyltransferase